MDKKPFRTNRTSHSKPNPKKKGFRNVGFIALLVLIGLVIIAGLGQPSNLKEVPFTQVVKEANEGKYDKIAVKDSGTELQITKEGENAPSLKSYTSGVSTLNQQGVDYSKVTVDYDHASSTNSFIFAFL